MSPFPDVSLGCVTCHPRCVTWVELSPFPGCVTRSSHVPLKVTPGTALSPWRCHQEQPCPLEVTPGAAMSPGGDVRRSSVAPEGDTGNSCVPLEVTPGTAVSPWR